MGRSKARSKGVDAIKPSLQVSHTVSAAAAEVAADQSSHPVKEVLRSTQDTQNALALHDKGEPNASIELCVNLYQEGRHNFPGWVNTHTKSCFNKGNSSIFIDGNYNTDSDAPSKSCSHEKDFRVGSEDVDSRMTTPPTVHQAGIAPSFNLVGNMESTETSLQRLILAHECRKPSGVAPLPNSIDSKPAAHFPPTKSMWGGIENNGAPHRNIFVDLETAMCTPKREQDLFVKLFNEVIKQEEEEQTLASFKDKNSPQPPFREAAQPEPLNKSLLVPNTGSITSFGLPPDLFQPKQRVLPQDSAACDGLSSSESIYNAQQWFSVASPLSVNNPFMGSMVESVEAQSSYCTHPQPIESVSSAAVQNKLIRQLVGSDGDSDDDPTPAEAPTIDKEDYVFTNFLSVGIPSTGMGNPLIQHPLPPSPLMEGFPTTADNLVTSADKWGGYPPSTMTHPSPSPRPQLPGSDKIEKLMSLLISDE